MAELAARSLHDRKVVGSNPARSNSDRLVSITRIDGYIIYLHYSFLKSKSLIRTDDLDSL